MLRHGHCSRKKWSPEYSIWMGMRVRCRDPKAKDYPRYGGRGIKVCERWEIFENFLTDMGERPSPDHSVERDDNDGHYEPGNCQWSTPKDQNRNMRTNFVVEYQGTKMILKDAAEKAGLNYYTVWSRIARQGWSVADALSKPVRGVAS
jgi:hypothetical protein